MKSFWINKQNNKNLIVFFAGWSFDENPFKAFPCMDYDVLMIYDYNNLSIPNELNELQNYTTKILLTWSMGVFVACKLKELFTDFDYKIALNGTTSPVDDNYGIPTKIFELTLKHAQKGLEGKFYKNLFQTEEEFSSIYSLMPVKRPIENRVSELYNLYDNIKNSQNEAQGFYDIAMVSEFDKIIPPQNQINSHNKNNTPVITLPYGHFPFYYFGNFKELVECKQTINI